MDNVKPLKGAAQLPAGIFSAAELQGRVFPPIKWIVPGILPEGLTLLAGKPKLGKSWLALDIAVAVASGGSVLGRQCEPGPVLCLALEDNQRRLQKRLQLVAGSTPWPGDLEFHTEWPRGDAGLERMRDWVNARPGSRLTIVDTLAVVRPPTRGNEGVHSSDYAALRGMHQLANEHGISVLVVHHVRKADAEDPFDTVSGSTGLTGAADSTLILTRRESDSGVILYGRGRDLEEFERGLEFVKDTCRWRDLGDPVEAFASDTRQAIFTAIKAGNHTPAKIRDFTDVDHELVKKTLQRMARSGDLRRTGRGEYEIPSDPLSPCPLDEEKGIISKPYSSTGKGQPEGPCPHVPNQANTGGDTGTVGTGVERGGL